MTERIAIEEVKVGDVLGFFRGEVYYRQRVVKTEVIPPSQWSSRTNYRVEFESCACGSCYGMTSATRHAGYTYDLVERA